MAAEYHQRWEVENTIDEFKVHLLERKTHIRSQRPREVVQENYGLLLGPKSCAIIHLSNSAECRNFAIKYFFHRYITSYSSCSKFQRLEAQEIPFF